MGAVKSKIERDMRDATFIWKSESNIPADIKDAIKHNKPTPWKKPIAKAMPAFKSWALLPPKVERCVVEEVKVESSLAEDSERVEIKNESSPAEDLERTEIKIDEDSERAALQEEAEDMEIQRIRAQSTLVHLANRSPTVEEMHGILERRCHRFNGWY